jgi:hypothetical protein
MYKRPDLSVYFFLHKLEVSLGFFLYVIKQISTCTVYDIRNIGYVCLKILFANKVFCKVKLNKKRPYALCNDLEKAVMGY